MIFLLYSHFTVGLCAISALFKGQLIAQFFSICCQRSDESPDEIGGIVKLVDSPPITYQAPIPSTIPLTMLALLALLGPPNSRSTHW